MGDTSLSVLKLGCGLGKFIAILAQLSYHLIVVNPLPFPSWPGISLLPNVEFLSGLKAEYLPFPNEHFDAAAFMGALLYFDSPADGLRELSRVLKPGARLVLRSVNRYNKFTLRTGRPLDPASQHLFTMTELIALTQGNGFKVEASFSHGYFPRCLTNLWWYLANVVTPDTALAWLSRRMPPENRVNNTLFLTRL
jgi:SAM-dependent methyltransferase